MNAIRLYRAGPFNSPRISNFLKGLFVGATSWLRPCPNAGKTRKLNGSAHRG